MAYGVKYRVSFTNQLGEDHDIQLKKKDYDGDAVVLKGKGDTLTIRSFNNDDDRFVPIISKECIINILLDISTTVTIEDFLAEQDDQWALTIYRETTQPPIFEGFLLVEDSSEPLLDKPIDITLRASDGLALLKNVPLKKSDGTVFIGDNAITDYIGHILYYVNPDLHFRVYYDIFHTSMDINECPLQQTKVNARTFEKDETTFKDSYSVLEDIMKDFGCRVFYENGYWHIVSIWQYQKDYGFNWTEYNMVANVVTKVTSAQNEFHIASIGKDQNQKLINKDALKYYKVASKSVKLTYNYSFPKEFVCNQSFRVGGLLIPGLSGLGFQGYSLNCWIHQNGLISGGIPANTAYVKKEFDSFNYEKDRYIVLPPETDSRYSTHLVSSSFDVSVNDTLDISIETKPQITAVADNTTPAYYVILDGDDGSHWCLWYHSDPLIHKDQPEWINGTPTDITGIFIDKNALNDWQTVSITTPKIPVDGRLRIVMTNYTAFPASNQVYFKNLQITYHAFIKDSYRSVTADYNTYEQNARINKAIADEVTMSDSPKKILKGSLFLADGSIATPQWFRTGFNESLRFTQIMALIRYTYLYRQYAKVEGTIKGLSLIDSLDNNIPFGFLPQYSLTDLGQSTTRYILTSIDINYLTGQWRGVLVECQLNPVATYDSYDFSYIF